MGDIKRFFRYIMPGFIFIVEVGFYLLLTDYCNLCEFITENTAQIQSIISLVLVIAVLGFILGTIYHLISWKPTFSRLGNDQVPFIRDVTSRNLMELKRQGVTLNTDEINKLGPSDAWRIVNAFWHGNSDTFHNFKEAQPRISSLTDIMHGIGSTLVGAIFAIPAWIAIHCKWNDGCQLELLYYSIIPVLVIIIHYFNYRRTAKDLQRIGSIIMLNELREEKDELGVTRIVDITPIDY